MTDEEFDREVRRHKAALTRAKNSGDPVKVLTAARDALQTFERIGHWPDDWARWKGAQDDALWTLQREAVRR